MGPPPSRHIENPLVLNLARLGATDERACLYPLASFHVINGRCCDSRCPDLSRRRHRSDVPARSAGLRKMTLAFRGLTPPARPSDAFRTRASAVYHLSPLTSPLASHPHTGSNRIPHTAHRIPHTAYRSRESTGPVKRWRNNGLSGHAPLAQLDRASDFGSEGRGFESLGARHTGSSLDSRGTVNIMCRASVGSQPKSAVVAQSVEQLIRNQQVTSSSLVNGSIRETVRPPLGVAFFVGERREARGER